MKNVYNLVIKPGVINFAPKNEAEEILQNVITICTTAKYSVPMDREFGIDGKLLDEPINTIQAKYTQEVVTAVKKFEPRAQVTRVEFTGDNDGKVFPRLLIRLVR